MEDMSGSVIGWASWSTGEIRLASNNENYNCYINDVIYPRTIAVLLHEILHVLGVLGLGTIGSSHVNTNENYYFGANAVSQYKNLLLNNGYDTSNLENLIPIENNFGSGTQNSHFEEGISDLNQTPEYRYFQNSLGQSIEYPSIQNEIMSGFLDTYNYITPMTLGVLEDLGFKVNYNSIYSTYFGNNLLIIYNTSNSISNYNSIVDTNNSHTYCQCKNGICQINIY